MNGFLYLNTIWLVKIKCLSLFSCCPLRKDKECAKLIVVTCNTCTQHRGFLTLNLVRWIFGPGVVRLPLY